MKILASRKSDSDYFSRLSGKDMWVLVNIQSRASERFKSKFLIRILKEYRDSYEINKIPNVLTLHRDGSWHCSPTQKRLALNNTSIVFKDQLSIVEPMQCYTTDELFTVVGDR